MYQAFRSLIAGYRDLYRDEDGEPHKIIVANEYDFGLSKRATGINKGYTLNTYVYAIISRIVESACEIPIQIYEVNSQNEYEEVNEGEFYDFVMKPNENESWKSQLETGLTFLLANGNVFENHIIPAGFQAPSKRYPIFPQYVKIKADETRHGYVPTKYKYHFGKKIYTFDVDEIWHCKRFNPRLEMDEPCYGLSPLRAGYRTLVGSNEILKSEAAIIKNRGMSGLLTSRANRALTNDEKKMAEAALKKQIGGGEKFGAVGVTSGNFDYVSLGMSSVDLQLLESSTIKLRDLCSIYGVSSRMFNDPNGATFNNVKEDNKKYFEQAVIPPLQVYVENFNEKYTPIFEEATGKTYCIKIITDGISALQEDDYTKYRKNKLLLDAVQQIIQGVRNGDFDIESGRMQLMYTFEVTEEDAQNLIPDGIRITGNPGTETE